MCCKLPIFQSSLMKHTKRRHKNMTLPKQRLMKNQKCEQCNQTFATLESLKQHKTIHTIRTSEFKWSMCENRFLSQRNLQSHDNTYIRETISIIEIQCDECSKTFNNHGSLLKHKESQHKETRFNCDNCNYKALQKATLILHKQSVHEGLKFQCDKCNHRVSWKVDL